MSAFIIRRLVQTIAVLLIVTIVSFVLLHMTPGDPAAAMLGTDASIDQIRALQKELWLDRPLPVQYVHWFTNAIRGDLGTSIMYKEPTLNMFALKLPITLYLSGISLLLSTLIGITAGIICAVRRGGWLDQLVSLTANLGIGVPI